MTKKTATKSTAKPTARAGKPAAKPQVSAPVAPARGPSTPTIPIPPPDQEIPVIIASDPQPAEPKGGGGAGDAAERIAAANDTGLVATHAEQLTSDKPTTAATAARVLEELLSRKPDMLVPTIDRLVHVIGSGPKRSVQMAAAALPVMARLAPARVAKHLPLLTESFPKASDEGKAGMVATFAALCTASVAYQKRLEPVLELALSSADPKLLLKWAEVVLPSLKGEPHARARSVVEERLYVIPRALAQPIATFLGVKLRPAKS